MRLYAMVAAVALLVTGVLGFSRLWGFDPLSSFYHMGVGFLFAYVGFWQGDTAAVRQIVGGLGVLLLVVKPVTVLAALVWTGRLEHGPVEITCLVLGVGSILAARYLPDETRSLGPRRRSTRRP